MLPSIESNAPTKNHNECYQVLNQMHQLKTNKNYWSNW